MGSSELKVGILGGTFDPPHIAHLRIAEEARETFAIDEVWFCPAFDPPHRKEKPKATFEERLLMTKLAVQKNPSLKVIDIERGEIPSYTITTLKKLKKLYPEIKFCLIIGWDSFLEFHTWYSYKEIVDYAEIIVCTRGKVAKNEVERVFSGTLNFLWGGSKKESVHLLSVFPLEISSTEIRNLRKEGKSIRYLVPEEVYAYILEKGLYTS